MPDYIHGETLLFDKPLYWSSFDLVNKVRHALRYKLGVKKIKVGHAGTLDPLATGLMIICTGKATRTIESMQGLSKEYVATFKLGETTPSFDLETEVDKTYEIHHLTKEMIDKTIDAFLGKQLQVPPLFSAKQIAGKRAYDFARKGEDITLAPNEVEIFHLERLQWNTPYLELKIQCSKGTYIRSLARDMGEHLKSGACLIALKRTAIGEFHLDNAIKIEDFKNFLAIL